MTDPRLLIGKDRKVVNRRQAGQLHIKLFYKINELRALIKIKEDNVKQKFVELYIEIQEGLEWHGAKI